ncbi:MAG TPA: OmpH family outer membrane protein [Planctomycetota bacterium]|nr:OmpH family outer membrane protein [Planctomycetota bacterium]OQC22155.1 MAG: Outer membrane protein (OmpH-like) [Planctomycetes bacterium ADurb.Bin069]HNR99719.1 OmpH family outer membrane protein [Planctomycetota bacterium]HNU25338.1 OmpH family outer membrane protein [Planctomycetota bacterium]HOE29393.1 OmpH family outer membrane protein [Planctomycetota bacterium]
MRKRRMFVGGMALAALAAGALPAADTKIAVLDLQRTMLSYERRDAVRAELDRKKQEMSAKIAELEASLKSGQSDLETLKPGTESYREFQLKLIELEASVETQRRRFELELELLQRSSMQALFEDVSNEVEAYAKENGFDLVLTKFFGDARIGGPHPMVLFAAPRFDITAPVIARLNAKAAADTSRPVGPVRTVPKRP